MNSRVTRSRGLAIIQETRNLVPQELQNENWTRVASGVAACADGDIGGQHGERQPGGRRYPSCGRSWPADATISEVVFSEGVYHGGLTIEGPKGTDFAQHPLLIRAAEGAHVVFDGAQPVEKAKPHEELPGVFWFDYTSDGGEYPKFWEPGTRIRYRLVADGRTVARFPATCSIENKRLLFHTSDGSGAATGRTADEFERFRHVCQPAVCHRARHPFSKLSGAREMEHGDRPARESHHCRGLPFQQLLDGIHHYRQRQCTTAMRGRGRRWWRLRRRRKRHCRSVSLLQAARRVHGADVRTGRHGHPVLPAPHAAASIRGNLCEGFGMGVFIKAGTAPYVVEHNTLVGLGQGLGFGSTSWHPEQRFRYNIIADCDRQVEVYVEKKEGESRDIDFNCYWSASRGDLEKVGPNDIVADPKFVWPQWKDYRLANDSPCVNAGRCGKPRRRVSGGRRREARPRPPREWHVSETGHDGRDGSAGQPVRTIQFAVDRARPGDTIVVHPGLYADPVRITRGGTKDRPIVIRAAEKWKAVLDCNRNAAVMIGIYKAPYVEIRGFEIRWYGQSGIEIEQSPYATVDRLQDLERALARRLADRLRGAGRQVARLHGPRRRPVSAGARFLVLQQPERHVDAKHLRGEPLLRRRVSVFVREFGLPKQQLHLPGQRRDRHRGESRREEETRDVRLRLQQLRHRAARAAAGHGHSTASRRATARAF